MRQLVWIPLAMVLMAPNIPDCDICGLDVQGQLAAGETSLFEMYVERGQRYRVFVDADSDLELCLFDGRDSSCGKASSGGTQWVLAESGIGELTLEDPGGLRGPADYRLWVELL
jgi:hypothetical protein